ncbi:MAG: hypothetical protein NTZ72_09885 [Afipia sp.]|nr:hypothetical protein [Afipia sp.]
MKTKSELGACNLPFFDKKHASPYEARQRLADVLAAIQSMALYPQSSGTSEEWAERIAGNRTDGKYWKAVFNEHPEFFRLSPDSEDRYALIWRRALPRRFDRRLMRMLNEEEYANKSQKEFQYISRPPISDSQVKTLLDTAITLHAKALEQSRDYRWWIGHITTLGAATLGAFFGVLLGTKK